MKFRCRIFGHEGAHWWAPLFPHNPSVQVDARRCYQCGDIVEVRERPRSTGLSPPPRGFGERGRTINPPPPPGPRPAPPPT